MFGPVWERCGLGEEIEKFQGHSSEGSGWKRALRNWEGLWEEVKKQDSDFLKVISRSQQNSLRLLIEWWNGDYDDRATMEKIRNVILDHGNSTNSDGRTPTGLSSYQTDYQTKMFECFQYELFFYGRGKTAPIQLRRQRACEAAACQRLAYWSFVSPPSYEQHERQINEKFLWNSSPLGGVIEPCPWLSKSQRSGMPYYLWDLSSKKTVVVADLEKIPEYVVISHTWGRWRLEREAKIPGVDWGVPQNSVFEVVNLPGDLYTHRTTFSPYRYVWIDLLCIPQDRSERARLEIARQAAIFAAASKAVAWLNKVDSWSGLQQGLQWFAAAYLHGLNSNHLGPKATDSINSILRSQSSTSTQLFESFTRLLSESPDRFKGQNPCGWFTSLWTLQESVLRPDITFCDKNWTVFGVQSRNGKLSISLGCMLSLLSWFHENDLAEVGMPSSAAEVAALVQHLELGQLLQSSPLMPLVLGNRRECKQRRAEAIMSAVGATEWYHQLDPSLHETQLVFDRYPIQFLREVHKMNGARFFCANYGTICCYWDIYRKSTSVEDIIATPAGTMLPFDPLRDLSKMVSGSDSIDRIDDPTTKTWMLSEDGTVVMPKVAVVASTHPDIEVTPFQDRETTLEVPLETDPQTIVPMKGDLLEWMKSNFSDVPKIAICLLADGMGWSQGTILMQVYENETPPKTFAKIGDYFTLRSVEVNAYAREVNLVVL